MAEKRYLYVLREEDTDFYRIGITHSINYRMGMLKGGNHRKLNLVCSIEFSTSDYCLDAENKLHDLLREFSPDPKLKSWYDLSGKRYDLVKHLIDVHITEGIVFKNVI